jgi:hypothetical protein
VRGSKDYSLIDFHFGAKISPLFVLWVFFGERKVATTMLLEEHIESNALLSLGVRFCSWRYTEK